MRRRGFFRVLAGAAAAAPVVAKAAEPEGFTAEDYVFDGNKPLPCLKPAEVMTLAALQVEAELGLRCEACFREREGGKLTFAGMCERCYFAGHDKYNYAKATREATLTEPWAVQWPQWHEMPRGSKVRWAQLARGRDALT